MSLLAPRRKCGREDSTVSHAGTTVVSCQQLSLKTNFRLVGWEDVWGSGDHCWAVSQNRVLYQAVF